ncbi:hypothetical protein JX265_009621 [Neoarthrinium moseri]|uniref:Cyclin-dependent kinase n=1 Tax=Neoarthrinium moseri TaxID=1658444 RepID=A0A9Q0AIY9_9PEZI|nr:uncharacterized protein JN550_013523 [Neoarthrinium moseri]KAI1844116.1 hypothetical protein JX266_009789 [Neoarthrinium moseri]KAI1856992.1 hypothetical protein JN550_013523 [Neoarthrinium moseri]KAI1861002.1 hypothetical protein JX265_009621 [Neoarthrinium moseri]
MEASPTKRRALATLDINANSPAASNKIAQLKAPRPRDAPGIKRSVDVADEPAPKRACTPASRCGSAKPNDDTPAHDRRDSASPETSSIFDNSVVDTSQATCITEVDAEAVASPPRLPRRPTLTRDEARQKAEILRLRLGLAGYKLRTGQEDVPLERLRVRQLPGERSQPRRGAARPAPQSRPAERLQAAPTGTVPMAHARPSSHAHPSPEKNLLPRLPPAAFNTPTRSRFDSDETLTSSAIKGGAAKGLLSLSRGMK